MTTRRTFLKVSAAASTSLIGAELFAQGAKSSSLPAPIAALKSVKDQARPIRKEEREQRGERARQLMGENHLDAVVMSGGTSLVYFTGIKWWLSERFFGFILPTKGRPFFVCPAFERDRAMEQISLGPFAGDPDLRLWQEDEDPYALVAEGLKDRGLASPQLAVEERTYFVYADRIAQAMPAAKLVSAIPVTAGCRMIKSAHELELMQLANNVTWNAYKAAYESLKDGMTQNDFAELVSAGHKQQGFEGGADVQVGKYSALPHGSMEPQVIHEGTILLIDGGGSVEGYQSDISRTFVLGKATDKMKKVFEIEHRAQSAALAAARPGVEAQSVDAAARKVITEAGYGPDYKYFTHRVGHGIGMDGHEWPYLVRGDTIKLQPNMCFSDEPGIYIRGAFGVRLEDDMHITEDGAKLFTPQSPSLEDPFGKA